MQSAPRKHSETGFFAPVWKAINELRDYCQGIAPLSGRGVRVTRTSNGALFSADITPAQPGEPGVIKKYLVKTVGDDTLACVEFEDEEGEGEAVTVAKPFELRKTGWDGLDVVYAVPAYPGAVTPRTIHYAHVTAIYRIATITGGGTATEHQVITPYYVPDKTLIFGSTVENGTGVAGVDVQDVNAAGRAWARAI